MATILLIDDKPGVRQLLAEELAFRGFTVITPGNTALVHEIIKLSNLDLIILDPYLKGEHRWDILLDIKRQEPGLPVLVITEFDYYRRDLRSTLAEGLLVKTFDFDALLQNAGELTEKKKGSLLREEPSWRPTPMASPYPLPKEAGAGATKILRSQASLH